MYKYIENVLKANPVTALLIGSFLSSTTSIFLEIFDVPLGHYSSIGIGLSIVTLILVFCALIEYLNNRKRSQKFRVDPVIREGELIKRYKGIITSVSALPSGKDEDVWFFECTKKIDQSIQDDTYSEVMALPTVGHTIRAFRHHRSELEYCWLLCSDQSGKNVDVLKYYLKNTIGIEPYIEKIHNPNQSKNIKETIDRIYINLPKKGLNSTDVIADITPGNRPMIAAIILSCIHSDRNIEYVEQSKEQKLIEIEITPELIVFPENIGQ